MHAKIIIEKSKIDGKNEQIFEIYFFGKLDESTTDSVADEIYKILEENNDQKYFIFDLESLEFLNSKAIGYFVDFFKKISEKNGKLVFSKLNDYVFDILDLVGVTRVIEISDTLEEARLLISENL